MSFLFLTLALALAAVGCGGDGTTAPTRTALSIAPVTTAAPSVTTAKRSAARWSSGAWARRYRMAAFTSSSGAGNSASPARR